MASRKTGIGGAITTVLLEHRAHQLDAGTRVPIQIRWTGDVHRRET